MIGLTNSFMKSGPLSSSSGSGSISNNNCYCCSLTVFSIFNNISFFIFNFFSKYLSGPSNFLQQKLTKIGHLAALYIGAPESNLIETI